MENLKNKIKGFNSEHYKKVKEARAKSDIITFRCTKGEKINFELECGLLQSTPSEVLREFIKTFSK